MKTPLIFKKLNKNEIKHDLESCKFLCGVEIDIFFFKCIKNKNLMRKVKIKEKQEA